MKTTIQIPVDKSFAIEAKKYSTKLGYSSLQEYIRVLLKQSLDNKWNPIFRQFPVEYIIPKQEAILDKRSAEIDKNIKKGNFVKSSNIDELMAYLNSG